MNSVMENKEMLVMFRQELDSVDSEIRALNERRIRIVKEIKRLNEIEYSKHQLSFRFN